MDELIDVLLVEDDQEDVALLLEMINEKKINIDIEISTNGIEAYNLLKTKIQNKDKLPHLIMLDLNMPKKNGIEFLQDIKSDNILKKIPVIIITSSKSDSDIEASYYHGASCFITKPTGIKEFKEIIESINKFWFKVVKYPKR